MNTKSSEKLKAEKKQNRVTQKCEITVKKIIKLRVRINGKRYTKS